MDKDPAIVIKRSETGLPDIIFPKMKLDKPEKVNAVAAHQNQFKPHSEILENQIILTLPIRTVSEANISEHWSKKADRHKKHKGMVSLYLKPLRKHLKLPCKITMVRYAPRKLDRHDNLPMSFKYILDACCEIITNDFRPGRADDCERIEVSYEQVSHKEYGIIIYFKC